MKRLLFCFLIVGAVLCPSAKAQLICSPATSKLACLIPNALSLTTPSSQNLGFLNEAIGSQVSDLPVASPASGIIYTNDPKLNLPVPSYETLGPVLTQRAETIGRHKIFIAAAYQFFRFEDIDDLSLKNVPIFLALQNGTAVTVSNNRLDLSADQFTAYLTFGLTDRVDISIAVPVLAVYERLITSGTEYSLTTGAIQPFSNQVRSGSALGIGDMVLAAKGTVWKPFKGGLAVGAEVRLHTGDPQNFLGSGAMGFKPYATLTYGRRLAPHFNISYEINGDSLLVTNSQGNEARLPDRLAYSGGADWGVTKWMTIAGDVLASRTFGAQRVQVASGSIANPNVSYSTIAPFVGDYNRLDGSFGIKVKPLGNLIVAGNILVKMNHGGLRSRLVPLIDFSYSF